MEKHDDDKLRGLVQDSLSHLHSAMFLMDMPNFIEVGDPDCIDTTIGFLLHLSTELILKAIIYERQGAFPHTHDLVVLFKKLDEVGVWFSQDFQDLMEEVGKYHQLRYFNTDRGQPAKGLKNGELEEFWVMATTISPKIEKIIKEMNTAKKFGIIFEPFQIRSNTMAKLEIGPDGEPFLTDIQELDPNEGCPLCKANEAHSH